MRKLILLWLISLCSWTASAEADLKQQLTKTIETFLYGASINDPKAHAQFWADGLTYTSSRGSRYDKDTLMNGLQGVEATNPEEVNTWYGAEDIEIKPLGEAVIVNFTLTSATNDKVTARFYNTGVFVHRNDRWQAINWNATVAKDKPN
ncbi:nuclear transport factor 2 family protein [Idiomarina seosinensis]|uniref:Nuclear transport factor 2 family protein n=1 Tax=Idiomarina seosinensis TaxID=281739 RepID=A0A432Z6Z1_9GAMM|nr:nuclear transport factor 2 family protein [Idiomarina seosinensis]RUO73660.1 nuclear transport factor 2 family protein [Idiomarina seosinensis]